MIGQSNSCQFNLLIDTLLRKREARFFNKRLQVYPLLAKK